VATQEHTTPRLLRAYHERGDSSARERLIELHLPMVESCARRYAHGGADYDDLYQAGCVGLINAVDRFDLGRGDEFAAFAAPNVTGEMRRYLRDHGSTVRPPRKPDGKPDAVVMTQLQEGLQAKGALPEDLAESHILLADAAGRLGERERRILYLRYVRDLGPDEIARELGISRRQLSRNSKAALTKLRAAMEEHDEPMTASDAGEAPDPSRYLDEPYHVELVKAEAPGEGWVAQVEELPGCSARGMTRAEATSGLEAAMREWLADALAKGREVPKPRAPASHSGRLLVRMPASLHADLARAAERDEVSLNQFITSALASVIGWQRGDEPPPVTEPPRSGNRRALVANLVVLVVLVILAAVLLVVALSRL
jgi:RNA polymerase sigma factor (sigma-70 family)